MSWEHRVGETSNDVHDPLLPPPAKQCDLGDEGEGGSRVGAGVAGDQQGHNHQGVAGGPRAPGGVGPALQCRRRG